MGHGKETPRQKMIGLMYLFLTCMLALNVSKDVLDAFININDRLNETNANFISKNQIAYDELDKAYQANKEKVGKAYYSADSLRKKSNQLVSLMQFYKDTIIQTADKNPKEKLFRRHGKMYIYDSDLKDTFALEEKVNNKDNSDVPAQIMVGQDRNGHARFLKDSIDTYRNWVLQLAQNFNGDSSLVFSINKSLSTGDVKGKGHEAKNIPWEAHNFEHLPLMAVITILSQMQTAVRNVEGDILNLLYGSLDAASFKFNKLVPIVLPNSTYVMQGNEYNAKIFLAAFDTTAPPTVLVNGRQLEIDPKTNLPIYKVTGGGVGPQKYKAEIKIKQPNSDQYISYFTESEFQVAKPSLVVSPTKMNVFYIGPENPVDISVPGVPADKITATLIPSTHGSISKSSGGGYVVKVTRAGKCNIAVTADFDGKKQSMGSVEFRIKSVPDPVAEVLSMSGGKVAKERLAAATTVDAKMKDFDFDLRFVVESFRVSARIGAYFVEENSPNNRITQNMKQNILTKVSKGNKVYFEEIKAKGPDGRSRALGVLLFEIQ